MGPGRTARPRTRPRAPRPLRVHHQDRLPDALVEYLGVVRSAVGRLGPYSEGVAADVRRSELRRIFVSKLDRDGIVGQAPRV